MTANKKRNAFNPALKRNGSAVKIEIGMAPERVISTKFPKEYWKTFTALCFVLFNFLLTTVSLSVTHELRRPELPPLPDITLDHIPYRRWALDVSEVLIMISTITAAFFVVFHKYRYRDIESKDLGDSS